MVKIANGERGDRRKRFLLAPTVGQQRWVWGSRALGFGTRARYGAIVVEVQQSGDSSETSIRGSILPLMEPDAAYPTICIPGDL